MVPRFLKINKSPGAMNCPGLLQTEISNTKFKTMTESKKWV